MRYNQYNTFKWIGTIPNHWMPVPIKRLFRVVSGATPNSGDLKNWDGPIAWITPADFSITQRYIEEGKKTITEIGYHSCGTSLVPKGSIIITKRAPIGNVKIAAKELCTNQGCLALVKYSDISEEYYYYLLSNYSGIFNALGTGTTFKEISLQKISDFKVPVPPRDEQDQIVRYLDWQVSNINKLIHGYQKQIRLFQEKAQKLTCSAVLHGLDETVAMKSSGIQNIESIPEHWRILQNKRIFAEGTEFSETGKETLLSVSKHYGVKPYYALDENERFATIKPAESLVGYKRVRKNDVAMNIMRARNGSFGVSEYDGIVSPAYAVFRPIIECNPKYMHYLLRSPHVIGIFESYSYGIAEHRRRLYAVDFLRLHLPVPPVNEQNEIVQYTKTVQEETKKITDKIQKEIELLREYRTRLISDVVTGQLDVRGIEIPDYIPEEDTEDTSDTEDAADEEVPEDE